MPDREVSAVRELREEEIETVERTT